MNVYLIRHGETKENKEGRYLGITDVPLSEEGREKILEKVERGYYPEYQGQIIYTSDMTRTKETLQLIYGDVAYQADARFNESNFGDFENKTYEELKSDAAYITWISGDNAANQCPNGESYLEMKKRVLEAFYEIIKKHQEQNTDIIIVSHGGPIVAILEQLHPDSSKNYYDLRLDCGEYYKLDDVPEGHSAWQKDRPHYGKYIAAVL